MSDAPDALVRAISFDVGDTLVFDHPSIEQRIAAALYERCLRYSGDSLPGAIHAMQRLGVSMYLRGLSLDSPDLILACTQQLLAALSLPSEQQEAALLAHAFAAQPFQRQLHPGAAPLLAELKRRGFLLAVISDWESDLPELLRSFGIDHLLDCMSVSSLVGATKPEARLFSHALECLGVPAASALHVGDYAELDAVGALKVGMKAVVFDARGLYRAAPPRDAVYVQTFAALADYLLTLPAPGDC